MFTEWDKAVDKGWPSIYLGNHDQPRMVSRFGSDKDEFRALSAKMLITFSAYDERNALLVRRGRDRYA